MLIGSAILIAALVATLVVMGSDGDDRNSHEEPEPREEL